MSELKHTAERLYSDLVEIVWQFVSQQAEGATNAGVANELGLKSAGWNGGRQNELSYALLGKLVRDKRVRREERGKNVYYVVT